jgi:type I restriction enzyme S subunit
MMLFGNVDSASLDDPEYFEILGGLWTGKKPPFTKAGVIRNTNFTASGEVDYSDVAWLDVEVKQLAKRQLRHGDIIIERSGGGPKQPVGRVVQFRRSDGVFSFSNFTTTVRVKKPDELDPLFAFYVLLELYQSGRTDDIQRRTTGLRNLDFKAYKERAIFPLISSAEQRRIARVLSTVQIAIEQQTRLIALTCELKSALMRKLFTEGLRSEKQKETEIGLVPESWEVKPLKQHCDVITSSLSYTQLSELEESNESDAVELLGIKVSDMNLPGNKNRIVTSNLIKHVNQHFAQKKAVQAGTVVFPKRGAAIATNKKRLTTTWTVFDPNLIGVKPKQGLDTGFIYHWFQRFDLRRITDPGPTPQLNKKDLEPLQIPIPKDFDEQVEIAGTLDTVEKKVELLSDKQYRLEELFRTLLHQLMTGQTRVNDLDLGEFANFAK